MKTPHTAYVHPSDLDRFWPMVEGWIKQACDTNPLQTPAMVRAALGDGYAQLFLLVTEDGRLRTINGCLVLEVQTYADKTPVCNVWILAGVPGVWAEYERVIEELLDEWSKFHGCDMIAMLGRPGWQRVVSDQWQTRPMVMAWRKRNDAVTVPGLPGISSVREPEAAALPMADAGDQCGPGRLH